MAANKNKFVLLISLLTLTLLILFGSGALAEPLTIPNLQLKIDGQGTPQEVVTSVKLLVLLTVLALVPAFLLLMTSFTRIVVVLSLLRNALGTQQSPPNQVLIGLALFLTIFIMSPVVTKVNQEAVEPYLNNKISQEEAIRLAEKPLRDFMLKQTREKDLALFIELANLPRPKTKDDVPFTVVVPAFIISELKTAFEMGFMLFIPFLLIDMVVASILMSMGMFMIPPMIVALPFKLLLFVLADGWYLVVKSLVASFS